MRTLPLALILPFLPASVGCLFVPNIAQHGYVACDDQDTSGGACEPGRSCVEGVCAPPPWHDEAYGDRRALIVTNDAKRALPAGAAVPVVVGEGGLLALGDVPPDFRVADFDTASGAWSVRTVHLDREDDRFTIWIPTAREVLQGRSDVLAWIESDTREGLPSVSENPQVTFDRAHDAAFEGFDAPVSTDLWRIRGEPTVLDGVATVGDNEALVMLVPWTPPVHATVLARINGVDCGEVFVGFSGSDDSFFALAPAAGLFVSTGLAATAQVGPVPGGELEARGAATASNALARIGVGIDGGGVRVLLDDTVVYEESDLRPAFPDEPVFLVVQVGGACSVDVDALWVTPLPLPPPAVSTGPAVELQL